MDLEKKRVGTRFKFPFVPITGNLVVRLPKTVASDRIIACLSGWAIVELGIPVEIAADTDDPHVAIERHTGQYVSRSLLAEVVRLGDSKQMKAGFKALANTLADNRRTFVGLFGETAVDDLTAKCSAVLTQYDTLDAPATRRA